MNEKPQDEITRPLEKIVRSSINRKCSRCRIGIMDGSVYMKTGTYCIPCAEILGAFDRFHDEV